MNTVSRPCCSVSASALSALLLLGAGAAWAGEPPIGHLDAADCSIVGGWAFDPDTPSWSIRVEVYDGQVEEGGVLVASGTAGGDRPDVRSHFGIPGHHGFTFLTLAAVKTGAPHPLYVYALDLTIGTRHLIARAPQTVTCSPANRLPIGWLDPFDVGDGTIIHGWAYDPDQPADSIRVRLYVDGPPGAGTQIADLVTSDDRPDVNQHEQITGWHGYSLTIPAAYRDGRLHAIYAYAVDPNTQAEHVLLGVPKTFTIAPPVPVPTVTPPPAPTPPPPSAPTP
ncbi:MAG: hypothetical protein HYZ96_00850, partial [Candidatus Omnitrophica bacterium]|nr:hypothetical protein [Candidatus Omnitrophota bacterium]